MVSDLERFVPCPGGNLPQPGHAPTVFLRWRDCRKGPARHANCLICGLRLFGRGEFWTRGGGLTRAEVRAACPIAVDGTGQPI